VTGASPRRVALGELCRALPDATLEGEAALEIRGVQHDSRRVGPGDLFVALPGQRLDGHAFLDEAARRGAAAALVCRPVPRGAWRALVRVADSQAALGPLAAAFFGFPSRAFELVGVTGTKGKTTLTYLLEAVVSAAGGAPGVIGTIEVRFGGRREASTHTTPMATDLQALFQAMRAGGVTHVLMEVSSHALALERVRGADFRVAAFTNLSRDHLDFHGDMERYAAAKALLFARELRESRARDKLAVVNLDDARAEGMRAGFGGPSLGFSRQAGRGEVHPLGPVRQDPDGIRASIRSPLGVLGLESALTGAHNLENLLAAAAIGCGLGLPAAAIEAGLAACRRVPGRLERVPAASGPAVFVDYAHTDQALDSVLRALRPLTRGRLWVVFGCGGDRDRGKRPLMGGAVARLADRALVTSDNPRSEPPEAILAEIVPGLLAEGFQRVEPDELASRQRVFAVCADRRQAIEQAVLRAAPEDVVLIAGKGHETYQIVGAERRHFDDREEAARALAVREQGRAGGRSE
jgi:UDP-N-acetylmuramoyl-L-alanyl-D-glutamate--2,6-diaminopimelate ligase